MQSTTVLWLLAAVVVGYLAVKFWMGRDRSPDAARRLPPPSS